jgi:hypothetical protein
MRWFRALIACCCITLLPHGANAAPSPQSISCDAARIVSQYPSLLEAFDYLSMPYARREEVAIEGQSLALQICAPQYQSVTADRLLSVLIEALPRLSSIAGVPLGGGVKRPILIVADEELPPSTNGQLDETGIIRVRNASPERTIIHEGAHYWASEQNFADTWMIEGYADYLTEQVTGRPRMAIMPEASCAGVVLLSWDYDPPQTALCGYVGGAAVFRDLAEMLGPEQLRAALRELRAQSAPIHSWILLVGLERISERDLTSIFVRYQVFPPEYNLQRRSQQWAELRRLRGLAQQLGVTLPQLAGDIDARDYDAADRWLSHLQPFLESAIAVAQRCDGLGLVCERPWLSLPQNPDALDPIAARLVAAQPLLDRYRELRDAAQALGLAPPAGLTQAAVALDATAEPQMRQALATLERGDVFEQQCRKLAAPCSAGWREQWRGGNIALAAGDITKQTAVLSQSMQVEARCSLILDACRAVWHPYMAAGQFVEADTALNKLDDLLDLAAGVEQRCGDMVSTCRDSWQAALRAEQLPGLELRLGHVDTMLARAKQQEMDKLCAGWNCGQAWRAIFRKSGDPQLVSRFLGEAQAALPVLQRAAATTERPSPADPALVWPLAGSATPTLIEQAHLAFEQGDVAGARALADQSLAATSTPRLNRLMAGMPFGITLATVLLIGIFAVAVRRKPRHIRRVAADQALLNELLSQPPQEKQQRTTNIKKDAYSKRWKWVWKNK